MSELRTDYNLTREEAQERRALIGEISYRIRLDLTGGDKTFRSTVTVNFESKRAGSSTFIDLLAPSFESATLNGNAINPESFNGLRFPLENLKESNQLEVVADCAYTRSGVGLHWFQDPADGLVYLYSDLEPFEAHRVFPCFDQPDLKATFDFEVEVPAGWLAISNMKAVRRPDEGEGGLWIFGTTPKISTYITAVCAGPYAEFKDTHGRLDLGVYCRQSLAQHLDAEKIFEITKGGFDYFEKKFDFNYIGDKYDHVFSPEYNQGAMENLGCVTVTESYIFRSNVTGMIKERRADTILHELAHMWFGDLVTMRWWEDLWLNESFATYEALMAQNATTEYDEGWTTFANGWKTWAYREDQMPGTHPIATEMPDTESVRVNFDGISYAKGCSVLRQLVAWVGEDCFNEGLRAYFKTHQYGNAELADFLAALEQSSGRDLGSWSKEWLEAAGVNTLTPRIELDAGTITSFVIEQTAPPEWPTLRSHRLAVGLYDRQDGALVRRKRVEIDLVGEEATVDELAGEKPADLVILNDDDLTFAKIRFDNKSLRTVLDHVGDIDRSLSRSVCWAAAWDLVRDGELSPLEYIAMVDKNLGRETHISVVEWTLLKAYHCLAFFIEDDALTAALDSYAAAALENARRSEDAGDFQLAWTKAFISSARSDEDLEFVEGLLAGSKQIGGCTVDSELRWHIVQSLAAAGRIDEEVIAAEAGQDQTEMGQTQADMARTALPKAESKEWAWDRFVNDKNLSLATMKEMMKYFQLNQHPRDPGRLPVAGGSQQRALIEPFAARYFNEIDTVCDVQTTDRAMAFALYMFPHSVVSEEMLARAERFLGQTMAPPPVVRLMRDGHDSMRRALAARKASRTAG